MRIGDTQMEQRKVQTVFVSKGKLMTDVQKGEVFDLDWL